MEVLVNMVNAQTHRFVQEDERLMPELVANVDARIFDRPTIAHYSRRTVYDYPGRAVEGLSFIGEPLPDELLRWEGSREAGVQHMTEIAGDDYNLNLQSLPPLISGDSGILLQHMDMFFARHIWLEATLLIAGSPTAVRHIFHG